MNRIIDIQNHFREQLLSLYDKEEADAVLNLVMEELTGLSRMDRMLQADKLLPAEELEKLRSALDELLTGKPVQQVLGHAWFMGLKIRINEHVLIPRPETAELVAWVSECYSGLRESPIKVIDVCCGSGCIALALKSLFPAWTITGLELSENALKIAIDNSKALDLDVDFRMSDILLPDTDPVMVQLFRDASDQNKKQDIIISNPPYVTRKEKKMMHPRVLNFEPPSALFVPDEDALLFYRVIAVWAKKILNPGGTLFFEINEAYAPDTEKLLMDFGYINTQTRQDFFGKDRMIKAVWPGNL